MRIKDAMFHKGFLLDQELYDIEEKYKEKATNNLSQI
jgi:hypothetical protein